MSKSKVFVSMVISFAVGVLTVSSFNIDRELVLIILGITILVLLLSYWLENKLCALLALFLLCVSLGALRLQITLVPNQFQEILYTKQKLEGYIVEEPQIGSNNQTLTFRPKGASQNIRVTVSLGQQFAYGDFVVAEGKIAEVKNFTEDFDYQKYSERFNIYAQMYYPKVLILKSHQLNYFKEFLFKIKNYYIKRASGFLSEPERSLNVGILIGGHSNLTKETVANFNNTGTSHIIAVSGFNITIIISAISFLAYVVGRRWYFWLGLFTIICFVIITGASASVMRAGIMGFLLLVSTSVGRQYSVTPALFFAGLIMLFQNPRILFWDAGFQLSFAATLGIIYFYPLLDKLTEKIPELVGVKSLVLTTLSAIVATMPLILLNFGTLSLSALFVNALILPVIPFAMLFGFLILVPFLGAGFAMAAGILLKYILFITQFFAHLPYSVMNIKIHSIVFWLLYITVFGLYFLLKKLEKRKLEKNQAVC